MPRYFNEEKGSFTIEEMPTPQVVHGVASKYATKLKRLSYGVIQSLNEKGSISCAILKKKVAKNHFEGRYIMSVLLIGILSPLFKKMLG